MVRRARGRQVTPPAEAGEESARDKKKEKKREEKGVVKRLTTKGVGCGKEGIVREERKSQCVGMCVWRGERETLVI